MNGPPSQAPSLNTHKMSELKKSSIGLPVSPLPTDGHSWLLLSGSVLCFVAGAMVEGGENELLGPIKVQHLFEWHLPGVTMTFFIPARRRAGGVNRISTLCRAHFSKQLLTIPAIWWCSPLQ